jgi:peptide/nickel transport system permease protein
MAGFVVKRTLTALGLLVVLSMVTFAVYAAVPVDPAGFLVDLQHAKPGQIAAANHALGLDHSIYYRYGHYLLGLTHGDLGTAWSTLVVGYDGQIHGSPVGHLVLQAAAVTGSIMLGGAILLVLVAVPLALISARMPGSVVDRSVVAVALIGISTHPLVVGLVLQLLFTVHWHVLDGGYCNFFSHPAMVDPRLVGGQTVAPCQGPQNWASHLVLPWITFALFFVAIYMRVLRVRLLETIEAPYVRTARAKGATERRVLVRHALPNVIAPTIVMLAMDVGTAIGISIYIESVYGMDGIGHLVLQSLSGEQGFDLPLMLGVLFVSATAIITLNALADVIARRIDPRIGSMSRSGAGGVRSGLA